ncbi:hypothetical protein JOE51_006303 [Bradyrhizobium japonicum]|nr:hypothetical protein [Bradyrhizobium japonicum]
MSDFTNFRAVYDELTDEVTRASNQFLPDHLRNWFDQLDNTPRVSEIVARLQHGVHIEEWLRQAVDTKNLEFGREREKALGTKLLLFRTFSDKKQDIGLLGFHFFHVSRNVNDNAGAFVAQVFSPMARELRRYLEGELARPDREKVPVPAPVPASDRTVSVDHNSKDYLDADAAMERLETALREANDFPDVLEREQREAEVSAARRLLRATLVRLEPLAVLLKPILVVYATKVKDGIVAHAATATVTALIALIGALAPLFKTMLGL